MVNVEIQRSATRKTIALTVRQGTVIVKAPWYVPKYAINRFVTAKEKWIEQKLKIYQQQVNSPLFLFEHGSKLLYLGNTYALLIKQSTDNGISIQTKRYNLPINSTTRKET